MFRMWKWSIFVGLAVILVAGITIGGIYLYRSWRSPPNIDKLGGTVLVFEVDNDERPLVGYDPEDLAAALKRRLDFAGKRGIRVLAISPTRIEVGIPRAEAHDEWLSQVKALAAQTGKLEFRILANEHNDRDVWEAAEALLRGTAEDAALRKTRDDKALRGEPPPAPVSKRGFVSVQDHVFTYTWLEVSPQVLRLLHLLDDHNEDDQYKEMRVSIASARDKGEAIRLTVADLLLYSRPCRNRKLIEEERAQKKYDWFLLSRDPERDLITREVKAVTDTDIDRVQVVADVLGEPAVRLHFNKPGGDLFYELTSQNKPDRGNESLVRRKLAIVLDGRVLAVSEITGPARDQAMISGGLSRRDVENLAIMLQAGSLPARLKPKPVEERTVGADTTPAAK
jgi:preprotein translocase subunit SecD